MNSIPYGFRLSSSPTPPTDPLRSRCRVLASDRAGTSAYSTAQGALLLRRLRLVSLIALAPILAFLVRGLLELDAPWLESLDAFRRVRLALHAGTTVVLASVALLLWTRACFTSQALRWIELILFGSLATFFAWLQLNAFHSDVLCCASSPSPGGLDVARLAISATSTRWFFLIVIYGVFIPNRWQRCAAVVGLAALTPVLLTLLAAGFHRHLNESVYLGAFDLAVLLVTGAAIAVFGTYRLELLTRQALEAQQLGQYRLRQRLGGGGMGEVYLAEHVLLRRPCALKLIRSGLAGDDTLARFEREVQAMATLTHPNTAAVFDYGHTDDGTFYYVMEYLPGRSLDALVRDAGPLPPARVIHFLRQTCAALREAHGIGLLHRDIKPGNIIACERGGVHDVAKLLDFGLVQDMATAAGLGAEGTRLTVQGTILGSPPYMSPEQAAGQAELDATTDVYSVGGLAYYLLTGQPPFQRETAMQMLLAHAYEPVVPPHELRAGVPADLEALILRCLAKKPADRYPSVVELDRALAACADAGAWTEERAQAWWKLAGPGGVETGEHQAAALTSH